MKITKIGILLLASFSSYAFAEQSGLYISAKAGAAIVQAKDGTFKGDMSSSIGYTFDSKLSDENKTFLLTGISAGYDLNYNYNLPIRVEAEYLYYHKKTVQFTEHGSDFDVNTGTASSYVNKGDVDIKLSTLMLNSYYDFYNSSNFTPYLGIGLGIGNIKSNWETTLYDDCKVSKTKFVWALHAGVSYQISNNFIADLSYRYVDNGKLESNDSTKNISVDFQSHNMLVGVRYMF